MFFFIIFGTKGRITYSGSSDTLEKACPNCRSDLRLKDLSQWFTLFFIPIFPIKKVDTFYQCEKCERSYKQSARDKLLENAKIMSMSDEEKEQFEKEAKDLFMKTLVACMTLMAKIDGELHEKELAVIKEVIEKAPDIKDQLRIMMEKITEEDSAEPYVHDLLKKCKKSLTSEAVLSLLANAMKVLTADGKIEKEEERLMKDYLELCGFPKSFYNLLLEKYKTNVQAN
jgi:tellurite resistance protein